MPEFDQKDFLQFHWHYERIVESLNNKKKAGENTFSAEDLVSHFKDKQ